MTFITQILLPKCNNFGEPFDKSHYRRFHFRMVRRYDGWSRKGQVEGTWLSPSGTLYTETHWLYEIGHDRPDRRFWQREKRRLMIEFDQEDIWMIQFEGRRI